MITKSSMLFQMNWSLKPSYPSNQQAHEIIQMLKLFEKISNFFYPIRGHRNASERWRSNVTMLR